MVQQRVLQGAAPVAATRVNDESGGLVDDDQGCILEHDVKFDRLGLRRLRALVDALDEFEGFAAPELVPRLKQNLSGQPHTTFADPVLQPAARVLWTQLGERLIEAHAGALCRNVQSEAWVCAIIGARRDVPGIIVDRRFACRLMWILHHA